MIYRDLIWEERIKNWISENKNIGFIDEVGRGSIFGDLYSCCLINFVNDIYVQKGNTQISIEDSKALSEENRELLYDHILKNVVSFGIGITTVKEIEEIKNINYAEFLSFYRAINSCHIKPDILLIDGNFKIPSKFIPNNIPYYTIVRGDKKILGLAAASIVAKVSRDRYIKSLSNLYPMYDLNNNKGYGTKKHYDSIKKYGMVELHRKYFIKNKEKNEK